jgi:hypothetical protein
MTQGLEPAKNEVLNKIMAAFLGTNTDHALAAGDFSNFYYTMMARFLNTDVATAKKALDENGNSWDKTGLATYAADLEGKTNPNTGKTYTIGDIKWNADLGNALLTFSTIAPVDWSNVYPPFAGIQHVVVPTLQSAVDVGSQIANIAVVIGNFFGFLFSAQGLALFGGAILLYLAYKGMMNASKEPSQSQIKIVALPV